MKRLLNWLNPTRRRTQPASVETRMRRFRPTVEALEQRLTPTGTLINPPTALAGSVTTTVNTGVLLTLSASDPNTPPLALTYTIVTPPTNGSLFGTDALRYYTPYLFNVGPDSFTFKVTNSAGLSSGIVTESITVGGTVTPPTISPTTPPLSPSPTPSPTLPAAASMTADERFVEALYMANLGRPGTQAEWDVWVSALHAPGGSPTSVASGILHTTEARDYLVKGWYQTYLGRSASGGEEQGWVNQLVAGATEEQVLGGLLATSEFYDRAQTQVLVGSADQRFVQELYQVLLNRTPTASELASWVNMLPTMSAQDVVLGFMTGSAATEYRNDQFAGYYSTLLHRSADATGLADWVVSNMDMASVRIGIEGSVEFYNNASAT